ncbi:hypothetical protein JHK87_003541 [Glycine soja]|nr:hypothetical protein JHK87_003541 [Glycine soja]
MLPALAASVCCQAADLLTVCAAAEAWIEALKASEKEILMETKIAQRELKESKLEQELEVYTKEKMLSRKVSSNEELDNWPRKRENTSSKNFIV